MFSPGMGLSFFGRNVKDYSVISDLFHFRKSFFSNLLHYRYRNLLEMCFRPSHSNLLLLVTPKH